MTTSWGDRDAVSVPPLYAGVATVLVALKFLVHLATNWRYGYFRDELYFLDCGRHLAAGYADHAPLVAVYARIGLALGGSLVAIRLLADVAGAIVVLLTILIARELGGGRFAQALAGICALCAPAVLVMDNFLSMNAFEPVYWMGCILLLVKIARTGDGRLWIWFGVLAGLGIENKHSAAFFLVAVFVAMLVTDMREQLRSRWLWYGVGVALLLAAPNCIWQAAHHFPTLELLSNVKKIHKNVVLGPGQYFLQQVLSFNPLIFLVWGAGLVWCFLRRQTRVLGWIYLILFVEFVVMKGKSYYFFPIHPMVIAAGAVAWEGWTVERRWVRVALTSAVVVSSLILAPLVLPVLAPERLLAYEDALHFKPSKTEVAHNGPLPQIFGDQFGWESLVSEVARGYDSLPEDERTKTWILAGNYGEAGAVDMFGTRYGLPTAISGHQNYYFWGPPVAPAGAVGTNLILLQQDADDWAPECAEVRVLSEHHDQWGMEEENQPILYCKGLKHSLVELWPRLKHWN